MNFRDQSGDDFHLSPTDTRAMDRGTDLSSDADLPFDTDIDGQVRSGTWDIGADEHIPVPPAEIYRAVGTNGSDLNVNSRSVAIAGATATFSGPMPDDMGLGDVLQYQVSGTYHVAFVHGRTSDTVYTVTDAEGQTPPSCPAGTAVEIFRAYTRVEGLQVDVDTASVSWPSIIVIEDDHVEIGYCVAAQSGGANPTDGISTHNGATDLKIYNTIVQDVSTDSIYGVGNAYLYNLTLVNCGGAWDIGADEF